MKQFLLKSNAIFGKPLVRYAQLVFIFVAVAVLPLEVYLRAIILFVVLFLCQLPLVYDIFGGLLMIATLVLTIINNGFYHWFTAVFFVWLILEIIKFLPFFILKEEDIPLPPNVESDGEKLVEVTPPPEEKEEARKFWD